MTNLHLQKMPGGGGKHEGPPHYPRRNKKSAQILFEDQGMVLSRGLTFAPPTHFVVYRTILYINIFVRNFTIKCHFGDNNDDVDCPFEFSHFDGDLSHEEDIGGVSDTNLNSNPIEDAILQSSNTAKSVFDMGHNFCELAATAHLQGLRAESNILFLVIPLLFYVSCSQPKICIDIKNSTTSIQCNHTHPLWISFRS